MYFAGAVLQGTHLFSERPASSGLALSGHDCQKVPLFPYIGKQPMRQLDVANLSPGGIDITRARGSLFRTDVRPLETNKQKQEVLRNDTKTTS
jgi:hypothetical protein